MQCWQCGASVRQGAKLCIYCGARLAQDDTPEDAASAGWERASGHAPPSDGAYGGYGDHSRGDRDHGAGHDVRNESPRGSGSRTRGYDDGYDGHGDEAGGERYAQPRRSVGPRPLFAGGENHALDPLDDPRAPRSLRKPPTQPRQQEPRRGAYGDGNNRAGYTPGDDGNRGGGGGYEHQGRRYTQGDVGYDPRYDPESGEYDAVADRRRREERYPTAGSGQGAGGHERRTGSQREDRYDGGYDDGRGGGRRGGSWDARDDRRAPAQDYRGGYGAYDDAPSAEYSAEYPARYDDSPSAEYSAEYPARYDDARGREYAARHSTELDARDGYGRERRGYHGGAGYDESAAWEARSPRGRAANYPLEDSWNLPAVSEAQLPAAGWTGDWHAAPATPAPTLPPRDKRASARGTTKSSAKRKRGRGLTAVVVGLVALIAIAAVIVGVSERSVLLSKLPGAAPTNAHVFATYTPGPTPTPVASYKEFSSDHSRYVLNYPEKWTAQTSSQPNTGYDYVDSFSQQSPHAAVIVEQAAAFTNLSDADIITAEVNGGKQAGRTFAETAAASSVMSIGGEQWTRREYDVSDGTTKLHMAILTCHHAGRGYAIVLVATPDAFAQDDTSVFKTVLNSFRFAS